MTVYQMINAFFIFSFLGYLLECAVLSYEYSQPVINRGFCHVPFCVIYGFGAAGAVFLLGPVSGQLWKLFLGAMVMATAMELVTAEVMIRLFGGFWWDYSKKRFNYKGIICAESSIAWGILGIVFFRFLQGAVLTAVFRIPEGMQAKLAVTLVVVYLVDFAWCIHARLGKTDDEDCEPEIGRLRVSGASDRHI